MQPYVLGQTKFVRNNNLLNESVLPMKSRDHGPQPITEHALALMWYTVSDNRPVFSRSDVVMFCDTTAFKPPLSATLTSYHHLFHAPLPDNQFELIFKLCRSTYTFLYLLLAHSNRNAWCRVNSFGYKLNWWSTHCKM